MTDQKFPDVSPRRCPQARAVNRKDHVQVLDTDIMQDLVICSLQKEE